MKNNIKYTFPQNEANKIENKYCSGHKKGNYYSRNNYYEIIFNKTGIINECYAIMVHNHLIYNDK